MDEFCHPEGRVWGRGFSASRHCASNRWRWSWEFRRVKICGIIVRDGSPGCLLGRAEIFGCPTTAAVLHSKYHVGRDHIRFEMGKGPAVTRSILCSHAQVAYRVGDEHGRLPPIHGPGVRDQHVIRPPQVLPRYNAETVWQALCRLSGGLQEEEEAVPARFSVTLTSCDAHRANLKCLRKLHCHLPADHLLLISICTQHRAANCIEALTKAVGNLTGVLCLSKVFNYRNVLVHLRKHVRGNDWSRSRTG